MVKIPGLRCPACSYCLWEEAIREPTKNSEPESWLDEIDAFDVVGADEGFVFCPRCGEHFDAEGAKEETTEGQEESLPRLPRKGRKQQRKAMRSVRRKGSSQ